MSCTAYSIILVKALGGLMPAFVDSDTGEVLVRVPRQLNLNEDQVSNAWIKQ